MSPSVGLNLRVTGHCSQGDRRYMEDAFVVAYQQTEDQKDLEYAYFGIFDGHGGREAALFAKEHLMNNIVCQKSFWSDDDNQVLKAIREGFLATHQAMWKEFENWPKTASGLPSTSGTTASIAFIRRQKLYIGHVGDSKIVLGFQINPSNFSRFWGAQAVTQDHKPESPEERSRIRSAGGLVMNKAGVQRVVWNRPHPGHKGPIRRNTPVDKIPFLAVARSLGDLWSYNFLKHEFVVSPDPDVKVIPINPKLHRCVIFASDGLWNMFPPQTAVTFVQEAEEDNEKLILECSKNVTAKQLKNPSKLLVENALARWFNLRMRADNTSVITVMLDPPGPPKSEVLLKQKVMQRLRPRDEQNEEGDESGKTTVPAAEPTLAPRGKKRTFECVEPSVVKEVKPQPEVAAKERKLSSESDVPRNLPKIVILSPQRVIKKRNREGNPTSQSAESVENQDSSNKIKPEIRNSAPATTDLNLKKRGHDPPNSDVPSKMVKSENKVSTTQSVTTDPKQKIGESSQEVADKPASVTKNTSPPKSEKTDGQNTSGSTKENGRVHLCEVDNIFKLNDRTTTADCNDSRKSSDIQKSDISPKIKNFRKSTLMRRSCASQQKSLSTLKKSRLSEPSIPTCRTRAQNNLQKLKV